MQKAILSATNNTRGGKLDWIVPVMEGLNNKDDPTQIGEVESPNTRNTIYDATGSVETAPGYIKLLTTSLPGPITGQHDFYRPDGTKYVIIASGAPGGSQYLYRYDNAGGTVQIGGPFTADTIWDFTTYKGSALAVNGADGIWQWPGTGSFTLVTASFAPQYIDTHRNRAYAAAKNTSSVRFSDAGNFTSWPVANVLEINTDDGQNISGIQKMTNSLKVFKGESVWTIKGEPLGSGTNTLLGNLNLEQDDSDVGCVSFRTIQKVGQGVLVFMASSGIYVSQNNQSFCISDKIETTFRSGMNPNKLDKAWGIYSPVQKKYLLGYASAAASTPDEVIMLDLSKSGEPKFSIWDDFPGSCAILFKFTQQETVLVGHPTKGYVVEAFKGYAHIAGDNGQATAAAAGTLTDSAKAWTTNQFKDAKITILEGLGKGQSRYIASNTATVLTLESNWDTVPDTTSVYTIGGYDSFRTTRPENMRKPQMTKRFKSFNLFTDAKTNYNLLFGAAYDNSRLEYETELSLSGGAGTYDAAGKKWDEVGARYDSRTKLFRRAELDGIDQTGQFIFGCNRANQPWRVSQYAITYKEKKSRAD